MVQLSVKLLGGFQVKLNGSAVTEFSTDKTRALLAFLVTESDLTHRRQSIAGLLWPDYPERSARTSLRNALAKLRHAIGDHQAKPPFLRISRQAIAVNRESDIWVDVTDFSRLLDTNQASQLSTGRLEEAAELYNGQFLEGFSLADSAPFDDWVLVKQEQLQLQMMAALDELTTRYRVLGDPQKALLHARRWIQLDPWHEPALRELMRLLVATGRRAAALTQFESSRRLLADELGIEPEWETTRLYEEIRDRKLPDGVVALGGPLGIKSSSPAFLTEDIREERKRPVFAGRVNELNLLHTHFKEAIGGRGRVVFVVGGAGRGKTVLLEEFVRQILSKDQVVVATGYCNAYSGAGDSFLPFRQVLDMLTGDVEDMWAAGRITKAHATLLWVALPNTVQTMLETAPELIETFVAGAPLVKRAATAVGSNADWLARLSQLVNVRIHSQNPSELEQHTLIDQYVRFLEGVAEHMPLIIILEDLHWADRGSMDLLLHIGRRLEKSRLLILCAYRPDEIAQGSHDSHQPIEDLVNELRSLHGEVVIDLANDDPSTSQQFMDDLLDVEPNRFSGTFRRALYNRTRGHPLFTVEMLQMLKERGDLVRDSDGHWVEKQGLTWDGVPARVEAVIQKRIGRLDPLTQELLSAASVEGEEFSAEVLSRVLNKSKHQVLRTLSQDLGHRHRLLRDRGELKTGLQHISRFRFSHHLIQRYVYNSLSSGERRLLHEEVAKALEDLFADDVEMVTIQLAYHYCQTDATDKALQYLTQAGHQARSRYDGQQAIHYYSEALALLPENHPDSFSLLAARAAVSGLLAHRGAQKRDIDAMRDLALALGDRGRQCDALLALAEFFLATEPFRAVEPAQQACAIAREMADGVREARALRLLAWERRLGVDHNTSLAYIELAVKRFVEAELPGNAADCLFMLGQRLPGPAKHFIELEFAERAMDLSRKAGDPRLHAVAQKNLASAYIDQKRFAEALPLVKEALAILRDVGDQSEQGLTLDVMGVILARLDRQEEAAVAFEQSLSLAEAIGSDWGIVGAVSGFKIYWFMPGGNYEGYLNFIDERRGKALSEGHDWLAGFLHWRKSQALAELGFLEDALTIMQNLPGNRDDLLSRVYALQHAGAVRTELGHYGDARQDLEKGLEIAKRTANQYVASWPYVSLANLALIDGERESLYKGLDQAEKAAEAARAVHEDRQLAEALDTSARLHLALDRPEKAVDCSSELVRLLKANPYLPVPQKYSYTHSLALRSIGRDTEANGYLRRAHERVIFVADRLNDGALRQSWLQNVRVNTEILSHAE